MRFRFTHTTIDMRSGGAGSDLRLRPPVRVTPARDEPHRDDRCAPVRPARARVWMIADTDRVRVCAARVWARRIHKEHVSS